MPLQHRHNNVVFLGEVGCFAVVGTLENQCNSAGIHPGAKIHLMPIGALQEAAGFPLFKRWNVTLKDKRGFVPVGCIDHLLQRLS